VRLCVLRHLLENILVCVRCPTHLLSDSSYFDLKVSNLFFLLDYFALQFSHYLFFLLLKLDSDLFCFFMGDL